MEQESNSSLYDTKVKILLLLGTVLRRGFFFVVFFFKSCFKEIWRKDMGSYVLGIS